MENDKEKEDIKNKMDKAGIEGIIRTEVKKFGASAHITISKKFIGKKAVVFIIDEEKLKKQN